MHYIVKAVYTCPAYVLQEPVELQTRDQDDLGMPSGKGWQGVSIHHAQNKL